MAVTQDRYTTINYLYPYLLDRITYITLKPPDRIKLDINVFVRPFSRIIWLLIFTSIIMFFLFDLLHNYFGPPKFNHHSRNSNRKPVQHSLLWIGLYLLLKQTFRRLNTFNTSMKICITVWLIAITFLTNFYCGYFFSILAVHKQTELRNIDRLAEACANDQAIPLMQKNTIAFDYIKVSNNNNNQSIKFKFN